MVTRGPLYFFLRQLVEPNAPILDAMEAEGDLASIAAILPLASGGLGTTKPLKAWFSGVPLERAPDGGARNARPSP